MRFTARSQFQDFPAPRPCPAAKCRSLSAADSLATRPATECASNSGARKKQFRTCQTLRAPANSPRAKHSLRWALLPRQRHALSAEAARSSGKSTGRERRRSAFHVSANPPPSSRRACRIFLRRAGAAPFPPARRVRRSEWLASDPPLRPEVQHRTWYEIAQRIRWRVESAAPQAVLEGREPPLLGGRRPTWRFGVSRGS